MALVRFAASGVRVEIVDWRVRLGVSPFVALVRFGVSGVRIEIGVLGSGVSALVALLGLGVWHVEVLGCVRLYTSAVQSPK